MKRFKTFILAVSLLGALIAGCNKTDSVLGPNGQNNQASFQMSQQNGPNGGVQFLFQPSVNTKISRIICRLPEQQFADTNTAANINYVYSKDSLYIIDEYTGVQQGQQWKFDFNGTFGQNNSAYNVTINYTAQ